MSRIEKFLSLFSSKHTIEIYKWGLRKFFRSIYGSGDLNPQSDRYFQEVRDHKEDIRTYFVSLKGFAPKTIESAISVVKGFLLENDVELPESFWRMIRRRRGSTRALTEDRKPTKKEMRQIISYMTISGRTLYLMQLSSGMRLGELLKIRLGDVDVESEPAKIHIKAQYTKSRRNRVTFLSREAKEMLEEWLKFREKYLERAIRKTWNVKKSRDDDRVFPFNRVNAHQIWMVALRKAGLDVRDETTGRCKLHPHSLRKFFISEMKEVIPSEIVKFLVGHQSYMSSEYHRYTEAELAEYYLKGEHKVTIFSDESEVVRIKQEVERRSEILESVVRKNIKFETKIGELEAKVKDLSKLLEEWLKARGPL